MEFAALCENLGIDQKKTMTRFLNREEMYLKYCDLFLKDGSFGQLKSVEQKIREDGFWKMTEEESRKLSGSFFLAAHNLKGVSASMGFDRLTELTAAMTEILRQRGNAREQMILAARFMPEAEKEYQRLCAWLNSL